MLESHFGLPRRPFPSSPDHACYYPATGHEQALQSLLVGLDDGEGVLVLTGAGHRQDAALPVPARTRRPRR